MKLYRLTERLDGAGMMASVLCAIHCALLPLVITLLPLWGLDFLGEEWLELGMIALALMLGSFSLGLSFFKHHRRSAPLYLLAGGFALIVGGHFLGQESLEPVLIPLGGFTIAAAHYVNWRFSKCRVYH